MSIRENRLAMIHALESGEYQQGQNALSRGTIPNTRHCCIGVQRRIATGQCEWYMETEQYPVFRQDVDADERLERHLIAMNDATEIYITDERHRQHLNGRLIRTEKAGSRDFPFVARFLRKVWGLTDA